jgi:hypothetical protein
MEIVVLYVSNYTKVTENKRYSCDLHEGSTAGTSSVTLSVYLVSCVMVLEEE